MDIDIMMERLNAAFGANRPIFTDEILKEFAELSRPRVFQLLKKAEGEGKLSRFSQGVYFIPTRTRYGASVLSVEDVVKKKYVENRGEINGIYGGLQLRQSFHLTEQVPSAIEIVTNRETTWVRSKRVKNRLVILRKARTPITKDNADAYTLLELFCDLDMEEYFANRPAQKEVIRFVRDRGIKSKDVFSLSASFPSKATRNIVASGIVHEFA